MLMSKLLRRPRRQRSCASLNQLSFFCVSFTFIIYVIARRFFSLLFAFISPFHTNFLQKKTRKNTFSLCSTIQIAFIQKLLSTLTRNRNIQRNNCISHCWLKVKIKLKMTPFSRTFPFSLQIHKYNFFKFMAHFSPFQLLVTFPMSPCHLSVLSPFRPRQLADQFSGENETQITRNL